MRWTQVPGYATRKANEMFLPRDEHQYSTTDEMKSIRFWVVVVFVLLAILGAVVPKYMYQSTIDELWD